ncbi:MAG: hypothetical protein JO015_02935 [Verrucomicrobia bacterium]|nr:hypothetical protein [Verrucomicrobiota bacterium]
MDPNHYVIAAVVHGLRHEQNGTLPAEAEFTPFNLAYLRNAPERPQEVETIAEGQVVRGRYAQTAA